MRRIRRHLTKQLPAEQNIGNLRLQGPATLPRARIEASGSRRWLGRGGNLIRYRNSGTGKTHICAPSSRSGGGRNMRLLHPDQRPGGKRFRLQGAISFSSGLSPNSISST